MVCWYSKQHKVYSLTEQCSSHAHQQHKKETSNWFVMEVTVLTVHLYSTSHLLLWNHISTASVCCGFLFDFI